MKITVLVVCALLAGFSSIAVSCSSQPGSKAVLQSYATYRRLEYYGVEVPTIEVISTCIGHRESASYLAREGRFLLERLCIQDFMYLGCSVQSLYAAGV